MYLFNRPPGRVLIVDRLSHDDSLGSVGAWRSLARERLRERDREKERERWRGGEANPRACVQDAVWPDECILMKFMQLRSFWLYVCLEGDCLI